MLAPAPLFLLALGCARHSLPPVLPTEAPAEESPDAGPAPAVQVMARLDQVGIGGLTCDGETCQALVDGRLHQLDPTDLALDEGQALAWGEHLLAAPTPTLVGPCPEAEQWCTLPLADALAGAAPRPVAEAVDAPSTPDQLAAAWNEGRSHGGRSAFAARTPAPGGGVLLLVRGEDGARVMRTGGGARFMEVDSGGGGGAYARALALHPTGQEAYLLAGPGTSLLAFDPSGLDKRWRIPLRGEAHGLFVEAQGRLLLLEEDAATGDERLLDIGTRSPGLPAGASPDSDLSLALMERPVGTSTALVDLAVPELVWREAGRYLSYVALPDGSFLLATDRAIVRLALPVPSPHPRSGS